MSTVPDVRQVLTDAEIDALHRAKAANPAVLTKCVGFICATVICCVMLIKDGQIALTCAGAVAGTLAGISAGDIIRGAKNG